MFDFVVRPVRSVVRALNEDAIKPLEETERETLDAVRAIDHATESIEHHVEVIETLATSVGPLTASVERVTETMRDLVEVSGRSPRRNASFTVPSGTSSTPSTSSDFAGIANLTSPARPRRTAHDSGRARRRAARGHITVLTDPRAVAQIRGFLNRR